MARTPAQRGAFGRWLTEKRTARYERQVDALADMKKLAGLHISQAEYSQWESGSRVPRADNPKVARLYEFFGGRPEDLLERPEAPDALVQALRDQTAAINELVTELRQGVDVRLAALEAAVALLAREDAEGSRAPGLPRVEAGSGR